MSSSLDSVIYSAELDELAALAGVERLSADYDPDAPLPWAVWVCGDSDELDLIGAGESCSEAIEDARNTVRGWEASRV